MNARNDRKTSGGNSSVGQSSTRRFSALTITAITFTLVGILIASQLDMSPRSVASESKNSSAGTSSLVENANVTSPFVLVIERASNAVVAVSTERIKKNIFGRRKSAGTSSGTGFFFRPDGYVLTNNHVVEDGEKIEIRTASGFTYEATLVGLDPATDLAVLKVDTDDEITYIPFGNSDSARVGDWAIAIGNPFPQQGLFGSATVGIVSAKGRSSLRFGGGSPNYQDYIQVDAAINPGNSGGPLLNLRGEAFGVNSAISSPTGSSVGIGFAVPINIAKAIIPDLIAYGEVRRGWLGVTMANVTDGDARRLNLDEVRGVVVEDVIPNSPAEKAGLRPDDIIYEYNGQEVTNRSQFSLMVSTTRQGSRVPLKVIRDRERMTLHAQVSDRKSGTLQASEWREEQGEVDSYSWMGLELATLTRTLAERYGLDYNPGVLVTNVRNSSAARKSGFAPGDVITELSSIPVNNIAEFRKAVENLPAMIKNVSLIVVDRFGDLEYRILRTR